eukprot:4222932-Prymnesium_polylepis.1
MPHALDDAAGLAMKSKASLMNCRPCSRPGCTLLCETGCSRTCPLWTKRGRGNTQARVPNVRPAESRAERTFGGHA